MADNRLYIQVKNHPETIFLLAKELGGDWYCDKNLSHSIEVWLNTNLGYGLYTDKDYVGSEDVEIITEN